MYIHCVNATSGIGCKMSLKFVPAKTIYNSLFRIWTGSDKTPMFSGTDCSIGKIVLESLLKNPRHVSQICYNNGRQYTNKDIASLSIRCAQHFKKLGLKQCDVFGICASNSDYVAPLFFGGMLSGLTASTLDPTFDKDGMKKIFSNTRPKIIFCDSSIYKTIRSAFDECNLKVPIYTMKDHLDGVREITEFITETGNEDNFKIEPLQHDGSQTAVILSSSGTTGIPKAVSASHESLLNNNFLALTKDDKLLGFSSLHCFTSLFCLICGSIQGVTRVIIDQPFTPEFFMDIMEKHKITSVVMPPSHLAQTVALAKSTNSDMSSLEFCLCTGSTIPLSLVEKFDKLVPNLPILSAYGMSEVGFVSYGESADNGSVGQLISNLQVKILDENQESMDEAGMGEICIKPPFQWAGYFGNSDATKNVYDENGWFHTGDIGYIDEVGEVFITGRKEDIMTYHKINIFPLEIEEAISEIPDVIEVCVCGIPDSIAGQLPAAAVVKVAGSKISENEVRDYAAERLAEYKRLHGGVYFVDSIPKTASGRYVRRQVQDICEKLRKNQNLEITKI